MNPSFDRKCSSGYESGWTSYFEREDSVLSSYPHQKSSNNHITVDEDDEEDLSMVSDASSGPPNFCYNSALYIQAPTDATLPKNDGKSMIKNKHPRLNVHKQHISILDDTASSPIFEISGVSVARAHFKLPCCVFH